MSARSFASLQIANVVLEDALCWPRSPSFFLHHGSYIGIQVSLILISKWNWV